MNVDELRSLLLALPGEAPVLVRSSDPTQSVYMLGDIDRISYDCTGTTGVILESQVPPTLRPPPPDFLAEDEEPLTERHLHLVPFRPGVPHEEPQQ